VNRGVGLVLRADQFLIPARDPGGQPKDLPDSRGVAGFDTAKMNESAARLPSRLAMFVSGMSTENPARPIRSDFPAASATAQIPGAP
jgi:hypothetical protein